MQDQQHLFESDYHVPVLFQETIDALAIRPDGAYIDVTFGGGGHSRGILNQLGPSGKLMAFDQDEDASRNLPDDNRLLFVPHNFRHLHRFWRFHQWPPVDGVLADLGVSSFQFDQADRGFSIRFDGPLDMRMDHRQPKSAAQVLAEFSEAQLHLLFEKFGEVTNAKTLAKRLVEVRQLSKLTTIQQLLDVLRPLAKGNPQKYFAQVFQALRIEVNEEMTVLKEFLQQLELVVKPGGRVAIITFHSIEDRIVKQFFKQGAHEEEEVFNPFEMQPLKNKMWKPVFKKPITASPAELKRNSRARSAKLRVVERVIEQD